MSWISPLLIKTSQPCAVFPKRIDVVMTASAV